MPDFVLRTIRDPFFTQVLLPIIAGLFSILAIVALCANAWARDTGQWEQSDPRIREWYRSLMRPDNPGIPCCGEADAYFADKVTIRDGKVYATITDDRPDAPLGRPHIPVGTEFEIPHSKLTWRGGNPTGHNILFVSQYGTVWCFVQGAGI